MPFSVGQARFSISQLYLVDDLAQSISAASLAHTGYFFNDLRIISYPRLQ
jgi:hypothetical protein